ncbi:MAG TPA: amidohydrolase family protein [Planctomycetota bacterium]|nr:amidohydrolase family protein [Planctomycetota bacterium]
MSGLPEILDCCAFYGRPAVPPGRPYLSPGDALAEMDRLGIAERWFADYRALEGSPALGNRLLAEELSGQPRLHPVWIVLPPGTGELPGPEDQLAAMARAGVHMVRAEPERHGWSLAEWCSGALWAALERARVPVLLDAAGKWDALDALLSAHPRLPVLLTDSGYRALRMLCPLLERHGNLLIETSAYLANEGLAELAGRFGAGRLVFGTGSPVLAPEASLGTLRLSSLSGPDLAAAAGGNLRRLLDAARRGLAEAGR